MKKYCINLDTSKFICCKVGWSPILSNARRIVDEILLCVSGTQAWLIVATTRVRHTQNSAGVYEDPVLKMCIRLPPHVVASP